MLRIFRGERHADVAAQPGESEVSDQDTQSLATPAEPIGAPQDSPAAAPAPSQEQSSPEPSAEREPGFLDRGRMRRRARFLRVARELAYRDLGGLVFDLHRFSQRNDEIVTAKLDTLSRIDAELRALESALRERKPVFVLREAGVAACPRCAAIHGSGDRFCPTCGLIVDQTERPIAVPNAAAAAPASRPDAGWPAPATQPVQPWPGALAPRAPAASPTPASAAPPAAPPIPQPVRSSDAAAAAPARTSPVPAPTRARPRAAPAAAPADVSASDAEDSPTKVIRSGLRHGTSSVQQTVAFDPIAPDPIAPPPGGGEGAKDGGHRQDRP